MNRVFSGQQANCVIRTAILIVPLALAASCAQLRPSDPRIVAIGDLHGDYRAFETVMTRAGLMDGYGNWAGGKTILVQTGDIPDRGPDTRRIIEDLRALQEQALEAGGQVITMVGNHDAMNVIGDLRYVHPGEYAAFVNKDSETARDRLWEEEKDRFTAWVREQEKGASDEEIKRRYYDEEMTPLGLAEHQEAWAPDGEVGSWMVGNLTIATVGDSLFVHGGTSAKYTAYTLEEINIMAAEALTAQTRDRAAVINDPLGPLWYRGLVREPCTEAESGIDGVALTIEEELDIVLSHFGVERVIVGHTPALEGIKANHNGRVIQIDTGMSAHYGGTNSFLEITEEGVFANNDGVVVRIEDDPGAVDPMAACEAVASP